MRQARDGKLYTKEEFITYYNEHGDAMWNEANRGGAAEPASAPPEADPRPSRHATFADGERSHAQPTSAPCPPLVSQSAICGAAEPADDPTAEGFAELRTFMNACASAGAFPGACAAQAVSEPPPSTHSLSVAGSAQLAEPSLAQSTLAHTDNSGAPETAAVPEPAPSGERQPLVVFSQEQFSNMATP